MNSASSIENNQSAKLKDKVILITGAAGDIGSELAKRLTYLQPSLILLDKNTAQLEKTYDELNYQELHLAPFDLLSANDKDFSKLSDGIIEEFGKLDIVINLAGSVGLFAPIEHYPIKKWYEVMQVNLNSTFMLLQSLIPLLNKSTSPKILHTKHLPENKDKSFSGAAAVADAALGKLLELIRLETKISVNELSIELSQGKLSNSLFPGLSQKDLAPVSKAVELYMTHLTDKQ